MGVINLASALYTSGTFWTGAGTVVGVLGTMVVVWVTVSVGSSRRRLYYWSTARGSWRRQAEIPAGVAPYELDIKLAGRGRKDIPSDAFDDRNPLTLDVGTRIVKIIGATSVPKTTPTPPIAAAGTSLKIGPGLIGKRQKITIRIRIDGNRDRRRRLTCQSPLIDVQAKEGSPVTAVGAFWTGSGILGFIAGSYLVMAFFQSSPGGSGFQAEEAAMSAAEQQTWDEQNAAFIFGLAVVLAAAGLVAWMRKKSRERDYR